MYDALGIHWGSSIPAFLSLLCVPMPFLFYKYGSAIRERCKYAAQSAAFLKKMQAQSDPSEDSSDETTAPSEDAVDKEKENEEEREEQEQEAFDYSYGDENDQSTFKRIRTNQSTRSRPSMSGRGRSYDGNPFDLDRINTRESFKYEARSNKLSREASRASRSSRK